MPFHAILEEIRSRKPLVHCISNIVTANDCANLLLAIGASPMMAQAPEEMEEITAISSATVLNTGTPDAARFAACEICGVHANRLRRPVVLDPVGVGASSWRLANVQRLLAAFVPDLVRVNLSEARALLGLRGQERGVDSAAASDAEDTERCAVELARRLDCAVLLSSSTDIATDGSEVLHISGGSPRVTAVTGSGCMLSALCGAFLAVSDDPLHAAAAASAFWKRCSEQAEARCADSGMGSFHMALIDAASLQI